MGLRTLTSLILITLLLSLIVGLGMMGMVFVPQFAENSLMIKYGPKKILLVGFTISMLGDLYLFIIGVRINSALATLSLVRSIGTSIFPAIMIGFIAHAGLNVPNKIMNIIGNPPSPQINQVEELNTMINKLKTDHYMAKQLESVKSLI